MSAQDTWEVVQLRPSDKGRHYFWLRRAILFEGCEQPLREEWKEMPAEEAIAEFVRLTGRKKPPYWDPSLISPGPVRPKVDVAEEPVGPAFVIAPNLQSLTPNRVAEVWIPYPKTTLMD